MRHKEPSQALALLAQATALKPLEHGVHHNAGLALSALGLFEEAADAYRRALNIHAMNGRTWMKIGWAHLSLDHYPEAMACFRMGSAMLPPDDLEPPIAVGTSLVLTGDDNGALHFLRKAKELAVNEPDEKTVVDVALGAILLRSGNWEEGWPLVEERWKLIPHGLPWDYKPTEPWVGSREAMRGKRVVVLHEQGFGDTIQFARYLPLVQELAAELTLVCPPSMRRLIETLGVHCAGSTDEVPYDILTGLMSLPYIFASRPDNVPPPAAYQAAPTTLETNSPPRIGICWHGDARPNNPPAHADDRRRSIPWDQFKRIADVAPCMSLQYEDLPFPGGDWLDTARIIAGLDLVISVDTAICHLAASLGIETWVLHRKGGCWRWLSHGDTTIWYPTMKLYRQTVALEWGTVVDRVADDLRTWVHGR
jgi:hypothetical protein